MSRPIFEPTPERMDSTLAYGSRQLFRRPAPAAPVVEEGGLPPTVILANGATTAPTGTWMPIPFSDIAYNDLVTPGNDFDWDITDTGDTGNDRYELTTLTEGWYEWELVTAWDQVTTGGTVEHGYAVQRISFSPSGGSFLSYGMELRNSADWFDVDVHPYFEMLDNPWLRGMGQIHLPANTTWLPTAKQVTGVSRGLGGEKLRLSYLGADNDADWNYDSV